MSTPPVQLSGLACRRLRTPNHILDNVYIEFDGPRIGVVGDFASSWLPPGAYNAREEELTVIPGLVDVHVHGASGVDFLHADLEGLKTISRTAARGGATTMVATTTLANDDEGLERFAEFVRLLKSTNPLGYRAGNASAHSVGGSKRSPTPSGIGSATALAEATEESEDQQTGVSTLPGTRITGIHLEGPFLNPDRRGAFINRFLRPVDLKIAKKVMDICGDLLIKVTLAPELPHGDELIRLFSQGTPAPVEISLGHTACDYELGKKVFENPRARQITHCFNAMNGLQHRSPNLITAAWLDERVSLEIIADGLHVAPPVVQVLHKVVGAKRLIATTDGASAAGFPAGTLVESFTGQAIVGADSGVRRTADHTLVGSAALMSDIFGRLQSLAHIPFEDALLMCSENGAKSLNRFDSIGSVDKGKRADFVVLRKDNSVAATVRDGLLVYEA